MLICTSIIHGFSKDSMPPRKRFRVLLTVAAVLMLSTSAVPIRAASASGPSLRPDPLLASVPVGTVVVRDPKGVYVFLRDGPRLYSINTTAYQTILKDPYQRLVGSISVNTKRL